MHTRSFVENVANHAAVESAVQAMATSGSAAGLLGAGLVVGLTGFHPVGLIFGAVLAVGGVWFGMLAARLARQRRQAPLDLTFDPAPTGGVFSPGTALGVPGGIAASAVMIGLVTAFADQAQGLRIGGVGLAIAVTLALVVLPTLFIGRRKWPLLQRTLAARPDQIEVLQDVRRRFPNNAPFPFDAPTDEVRVP